MKKFLYKRLKFIKHYYNKLSDLPAGFRSIFDDRYKISYIAPHVQIGNAHLAGKNYVHSGCNFGGGDISIGYASNFGDRCILGGGKITIGKYVQFGPDVAAYASGHPYTHITNYVSKELFDGRLGQYSRKGVLVVQNDVWVGHGAVLLNNITVGDGAVIGAGAVVVKDIPPYAIAGGVPAKVLRYRFPDETIRLLLKLRWWDLGEKELIECEPLFHIDFEKDPARFYDYLNGAVEKYRHKKIDDQNYKHKPTIK